MELYKERKSQRCTYIFFSDTILGVLHRETDMQRVILNKLKYQLVTSKVQIKTSIKKIFLFPPQVGK
jgi:hypothetical protein